MPLDTAATMDAPDDDSPELDAERALVAQWAAKIKRARAADKDTRKTWTKWRRYAAGMPVLRKSGWPVTTNLIEATIEGLLPSLYAQDPDVSITPADAVNPAQYAQVRGFAKSVQTVVSRLLWDAGLKSRMQRMIRSAMVIGLGAIKVSMQLDPQRDPIIERRIADAQEQLERISVLIAALADNTVALEAQQAAQAELQAQIESLQTKVEVMRATGITIDMVSMDDLQVDDELREIADYGYANWIAQRVWYTPEGAKAEFGLDDDTIRTATTYPNRTQDGDEDAAASPAPAVSTASVQPVAYLAAWEIWDKRSATVFTLLDGVQTWARAPYPPQPAGSRFYPFFLLAFHYLPDQRFPISDVDLWHKLQDEYSNTRSNYAEQRRRTTPARVFNKRAVTTEDAKRLFNPDINEGVGVDPLDGTDVRTLVGIIPTPPIDAALYDTSAIRYDLEQLSGLGDAQRTAMVRAKTATEANIIANSSASRISVRQDTIEDVMEAVCIYVAELALQSMPAQDAARYAGPGVLWPQLPLEQVHTLLDISIRAGSTGKPDQMADRQAWTQAGPQLWQAVTSTFQAMAGGNAPLVDAYRSLLRMTLDKLALKIDVNEIIPEQAQQQSAQPPPSAPDAKQDDILIRNGTMTIDEARALRGMPPLPGALGAIPLVYMRNAVVPLSAAVAGGTPIQEEVVPGTPLPQQPIAPMPGASPDAVRTP